MADGRHLRQKFPEMPSAFTRSESGKKETGAACTLKYPAQATCIGLFTLQIGHFRLRPTARPQCRLCCMCISSRCLPTCIRSRGRAFRWHFAFLKAFSDSAISTLATTVLHLLQIRMNCPNVRFYLARPAFFRPSVESAQPSFGRLTRHRARTRIRQWFWVIQHWDIVGLAC